MKLEITIDNLVDELSSSPLILDFPVVPTAGHLIRMPFCRVPELWKEHLSQSLFTDREQQDWVKLVSYDDDHPCSVLTFEVKECMVEWYPGPPGQQWSARISVWPDCWEPEQEED